MKSQTSYVTNCMLAAIAINSPACEKEASDWLVKYFNAELNIKAFRTIIRRGQRLRWFFTELKIENTLITFLKSGGMTHFPWSTIYNMKDGDLAALANYFTTTGSYELYLVMKDFGLLTDEFPFPGPVNSKARVYHFKSMPDPIYQQPFEISQPQQSKSSDGSGTVAQVDEDKEIELFFEANG